jgi:hypothetical protein
VSDRALECEAWLRAYAYPGKLGPKDLDDTREAFADARRDASLETLEIAGQRWSRAYAEAGCALRWVMKPANWLRGQKWLEDLPPRLQWIIDKKSKPAKAAKANGSKPPAKTKSKSKKAVKPTPKSEFQLRYPVGTRVQHPTLPLKGEVTGYLRKDVVVEWDSGVERPEQEGAFYKWVPKPEPDAAQLAAERAATQARREQIERDNVVRKEREERERAAKAEQEKRSGEWRRRWLSQPWKEYDDFGEAGFSATMEDSRITVHESEPGQWRGSVVRGNWGEVTGLSYPTALAAKCAAIDILFSEAERAP